MAQATEERAFGRVSALLETVDIELDRVRLDRARYRDGISENPAQDELNVDSLQRLLETRLPQANAHPADDYADLHRILLVLGIDSQSKLLGIIAQCKDDILALDQAVASELFAETAGETGAFMTHTGLVKLMLNDYLGVPWEQALAERVAVKGGRQ